MPLSLLPSTISLLPPSPHLLSILALLFEPGAAPHIYQALLLGSQQPPPDSDRHFTTYHTLITHIRSILLGSLLSSSSSPPVNTNNYTIDKNNNNGEGEEEAEEQNTEAYGLREIIKQIVNAHPRLGSGAPAAEVRAGNSSSSTDGIAAISELSTKEQAQLKQQAGKEAEEAELLLIRVLNEEYEKKFNGLRFVTYVNGRGRQEVLGEMRERLMVTKGDGLLHEEEEMRVAIEAVCDIAEDRVRTLRVVQGD